MSVVDTDADVVLGEPMRKTFQYLESAYNDGDRFLLHYVSARELYNIIKAAEDGQGGDPEAFRDYRIDRPQFDSRPQVQAASDELLSRVQKTYIG